MAPTFATLVHAADLHLGSPFEGLGPAAPRIAEALREASFTALGRIVDLALEREADALLVAGDVYDSADRSLHAQRTFRDELGRAARGGVRSFVIHGNHDPLSGWQAPLELPAEVHRFGAAVEVVPLVRDGEVIGHVAGSSYPVRDVLTSQVPAYARALEGLDSPFVVAELHAHLGGDPNHAAYAPTSVSELASVAEVDYWALGHVHAFRHVPGRPTIVYPGTAQGRSPRESGPRGVALVRVAEPRPSSSSIEVELVPTAAVAWERATIEIGELAGFDALFSALAAVRDEWRSPERGAVVTVALAGRGALHDELSRLDFARDLLAPLREGEDGRDDFVWVESIRDRTAPLADLAAARQREDLVGDFLRAKDELAADPARVRELLAGRAEGARVADGLRAWSEERLAGLLDAAEVLGHDLLTGPADGRVRG